MGLRHWSEEARKMFNHARATLPVASAAPVRYVAAIAGPHSGMHTVRFAMQIRVLLLAAPVALSLGIDPAAAQQSVPNQPGAAVQGSPDTTIGGKSAVRSGDAGVEAAPAVESSPDVFINGKPATTLGGGTGCNGVVIGGSSSVFINGKPAAVAGSPSGCPRR
jgi:uncharacterized Zn-binding protein involved in type VI secretion